MQFQDYQIRPLVTKKNCSYNFQNLLNMICICKGFDISLSEILLKNIFFYFVYFMYIWAIDFCFLLPHFPASLFSKIFLKNMILLHTLVKINKTSHGALSKITQFLF